MTILAFQISMILKFKYGMIYRDALVQKPMDWCEGARSKISTDRGLQQLLTIFKAGDPNSIHECPYYASIILI